MKLKITALAAALPPTHSFHGSIYNVILFLSCMVLHRNSEIYLHHHSVYESSRKANSSFASSRRSFKFSSHQCLLGGRRKKESSFSLQVDDKVIWSTFYSGVDSLILMDYLYSCKITGLLKSWLYPCPLCPKKLKHPDSFLTRVSLTCS